MSSRLATIARGAALWLAMALLFLVANRGAYEGYFSDDDLDNMVVSRGIPAGDFARGILNPTVFGLNFRPVGHFWYWALTNTAGLRFPAYVAATQALHLVNVLLVWVVLRRLGATALAAGSGALLFAFHMACFDAYWKPMFVFDVLCATLLLLCLLAYLHGRWLEGLVLWWLAYKTKEAAIAFPLALVAWEWLCGERRWRRAAPFVVIAASFAVQALFRYQGSNFDYTFQFSPAALWTTFSFYSSKIFLLPYAGALLIPLAVFVRERRVRFGLLSIALLLGPMWFLPGRLFGVYLYVPLIGAAVAFCFLAQAWKPAWIALFFAAWIPWNHYWLREQRRAALTVAQENRHYVEAAAGLLRENPDLATVLYEGGPEHLAPYGIEAAFRWFRPDERFEVRNLRDERASEYLKRDPLAVVWWDGIKQGFIPAVHRASDIDPAFVTVAFGNPAWLFGEGWYPIEGRHRWIGPVASVRLRRPAHAREFALRILFGPLQYKDQGRVEMEVLLDGRSLGSRLYEKDGLLERRWTVPDGPEGSVTVTLRTLHPYRPSNGDPRVLGTAIMGLGFVEEDSK